MKQGPVAMPCSRGIADQHVLKSDRLHGIHSLARSTGLSVMNPWLGVARADDGIQTMERTAIGINNCR